MRRAAVIGCGRMGAFTSPAVRAHAPACWFPLAHAEAIQAHGALDLAALCDANADGLARAQQHYQVMRGFGDHRTLLAEFVPELVGIATRTPGRADIIADCVAAGTTAFHVEKPLCNSVWELDKLAQLLASGEIFATYGTVRRFFPVYQAASTMARSGRFGALREIRATLGEGALYWTHPHAVDLILMAAGERKVEAVQARLTNVQTGRSTTHITSDPIIASASIWFDDGLAGHIGRAPGMDLILSCQTGEVTVLNDGHALALADFSGDVPYPQRLPVTDGFDPTAPAGTLAAIRQLVGCLDRDSDALAANLVTRNDIVRGQRILFAMVQSHLEGGRPVVPYEVDSALVIEAYTGQNHA